MIVTRTGVDVGLLYTHHFYMHWSVGGEKK